MNSIRPLLFLALVATPILIAQEQDSPLEKQMQILARGKRQLTQQVADPAKQQQNIALIESLKKAVATSKTLDPRKTATVAAADREKFLSSYRVELDKLSDTFNRIEDSLKAGQYDQAKSQLADLQSVMKEGHREFKQD